jgi:hypothetical protein
VFERFLNLATTIVSFSFCLDTAKWWLRIGWNYEPYIVLYAETSNLYSHADAFLCCFFSDDTSGYVL